MSAEPRTVEAAIDSTLLMCRIIAGALVFGVATFAAVAVVLRLDDPPAADALISLIAAGFAAASVVIRQVLVSLIGGRTGSSQAAGAFGPLLLYQTRMIAGLAILEGAALFNVVAYLIEGHWWSLAAAAGLLAVMLASFPTRGRLRRWVETREQLKTFGPG